MSINIFCSQAADHEMTCEACAAARMGRQESGPVNLDEGLPMDIYELFEQVTGREYDHTSHADELQILNIAQAYETAHANPHHHTH